MNALITGPAPWLRRTLVSVFSCLFLYLNSMGPAQAATMNFAIIGDMPYNARQRTEYLNLIKELNKQDLAFVVHTGDMWFDGIAWNAKSKGLPPCSDAVFDDRLKLARMMQHPFIITPGDNDWTDCYRAKPRAYDPLERLQKLRTMFFQGDESLGQRKIKLIRQSTESKYSGFPENVRWTYGGAMFITLHMVGSNNNLGRTARMDKEYEKRNAANIVWLEKAFSEAKKRGSKALMIISQADPNFENRWSAKLQGQYMLKNLKIKPPSKILVTGFDGFLDVLEEQTRAFGKPVVYVHGDTHTFRIDKPLVRTPGGNRFIENFTRVENFGFPNTHWVRATIDDEDPNVFRFSPMIVDANRVKE